MKLPKKLGKEPLIEALFDMRFKPTAPASSILPGLVFANFPGEKKVEKLPAADLPETLVVQLDPNFRYAPAVRIHWDKFMILSGSHSAGIACKLPYPGWTDAFKPAILQLTRLIGEAGFVDTVERFSLKYTNILMSELGSAPSVAEFTLKIGSRDAARNLFQIRAEFPSGSLVSVVQIAAEATATFVDGKTTKGVTIDVDTIAMTRDMPFPVFLASLADGLEAVHSEAKSIFFGCLKPEALEKLEPVYE